MRAIKNALYCAGLAALYAFSDASAAAAPAWFESLAPRCAPSIHPQTLAALVDKESAFDPLVIHVNAQGSDLGEVLHPADASAAVQTATALIQKGRSVDLGLGQINSANLQRLGLAAATVFDACRNLTAAGVVLQEGYERFIAKGYPAQAALDAALSTYNAGNAATGMANGYVADVRKHAEPAGYVVPALSAQLGQEDRLTATPAGMVAAQAPVSPPASWDVFGDMSPGATSDPVLIRARRQEPTAPTLPPATPTAPNQVPGPVRQGGQVLVFAEPDQSPGQVVPVNPKPGRPTDAER